MPTPSPLNLRKGAGEVFIDLMVNGAFPGNWRHMGLVDQFDITMSADTEEVKNSMDGLGSTYREIQTGTKAALAVKFREFTPENIALALGGTVTTWSQSSSTATDLALGNLKKGYGLSTGTNQIVVTSVKKGATVLVNAGSATGTGDYWVHGESGTIFILETPSTGTLADGDALTWSGTIPAITGKPQINGLSGQQIFARLKYVAAKNMASGKRSEVLVPMATVYGDSAVSLISDKVAEVTLKGSCLIDPSQAAGEQIYRERFLS